MATLIFDSTVLNQASRGLSDKIGHEPGLIATGDHSADKLLVDAATAGGSRIALAGTAADALSMTARRKKLAMAPVTARVRGNTRRTANAVTDSKRRPGDGGSHSKVTINGAFDATLIAAETVHAAVLFADMRGYMGLAERLPPARVVFLLDEFFTILARVTVAFRGEVFHMAGDGMMAGFGVRDQRRSGAREALLAGREMLQCFAPIATRWGEEFGVVTGIGIGLHLGEVALGLLGPPGKRTITMIGDTANVAARLCSRARAGEVLFSCAIAAALVDDGDGPAAGPKPFLQLPQFELRGRSELLDIWCVPAPECVAQ
jgi:class 3 adenylate cyclase